MYAGQKRVPQKENRIVSDLVYILALGAGYDPMVIVFHTDCIIPCEEKHKFVFFFLVICSVIFVDTLFVSDIF